MQIRVFTFILFKLSSYFLYEFPHICIYLQNRVPGAEGSLHIIGGSDLLVHNRGKNTDLDEWLKDAAEVTFVSLSLSLFSVICSSPPFMITFVFASGGASEQTGPVHRR